MVLGGESRVLVWTGVGEGGAGSERERVVELVWTEVLLKGMLGRGLEERRSRGVGEVGVCRMLRVGVFVWSGRGS